MNLIGSHDTARAIYLLGGEGKQVIAEKGKNIVKLSIPSMTG